MAKKNPSPHPYDTRRKTDIISDYVILEQVIYLLKTTEIIALYTFSFLTCIFNKSMDSKKGRKVLYEVHRQP